MVPPGTAEPSPGDVEAVFRGEYGRVLATLVRDLGDITRAEDAVQEAFAVASERWPATGVPPNPGGWIVTTARRRAIDGLRRDARGRELHWGESAGSDDVGPTTAEEDEGPVRDDRLRLIFTCCHPALRVEHQVALTLRLLGGLSVEDLARSFLISEPAMAKRLVRAKHKIKAAKIPYRVPVDPDLPDRLESVLSVVYLIYTTGADDPDRAALRDEAVRLARALVDLMPDEPEAAGLLALVLLVESRMPARGDAQVVLLRDQDRTRWHKALVEEGHRIVRGCLRRDRPGPFQLQAAIQAVHCDAESFEDTDWKQIVALYDHLLSLMPTAVVALNRAIAVGEVSGPAPALALIDDLEPDLVGYQPWHAARGEMMRRLGDLDGAADAFDRAADLAANGRDRAFLQGQAADLR